MNFDTELWWCIVVGLAGLATLFWVYIWLSSMWKAFYLTTWFRPEKKAYTNKPTWNDVRNIILSDPLKEEHEGHFRGVEHSVFLGHAASILVVLGLIGAITGGLIHADLIKAIKDISTEKITAIGVMLGVGITLYTAFRQIVAKVRSENRQKWINEVRAAIATVTGFITANMVTKDEEDLIVYEQSMMKLELLLNPLEKDHRALGYILRKVYGCPIYDVDKFISERAELDFLREMDARNIDDLNKMVGYVIKLSNAILKREWERVKQGA